MYKNPRMKPINPVYKVKKDIFRIGAQIGITAEFEDHTNQLWTLAQFLDGSPVSIVLNKMQDKFPNLSKRDIIEGIDLLDDEGFVEEVLPEEHVSPRYEANVNFFSRFFGATGNRFLPQKTLCNSTILLLGLGGGGSNILALLAGVGLKKLKIVDFDKVEINNLGRQIIYKESDVGKYKVDVAAEVMKSMNSDIEVEVHNDKIESSEDVLKYLDGVDLVISVIDEPRYVCYRIVNSAIVQADIPCVFAASQVSRGRVFSVIPHVSGCFDCLNIHYTQRDPMFLSQYIALSEMDFNPPTIAYVPAMYQLTSAVVDEAVRILTHYAKPRSVATQFEINYEDGSSFQHESWPRFEKECPTCGTGREDDWKVFDYYKIPKVGS